MNERNFDNKDTSPYEYCDAAGKMTPSSALVLLNEIYQENPIPYELIDTQKISHVIRAVMLISKGEEPQSFYKLVQKLRAKDEDKGIAILD